MTNVPSRPPSLLENLGWAFYLACSWTWCIGMYLPVLLYREYGFGGWIVFAIPNIVGAAAMAWVLPERAVSLSFADRHRLAMLAFSLSTIAFQGYFLGWLMTRMPMPYWAVGCVCIAVVWTWGSESDLRSRLSAALVWSFSAAVFVFGLLRGEFLDRSVLTASRLGAPSSDLVWLAPACGFGFLLCPYLDLTFHHVRQQTTRAGGRFAFGTGFGFLFPVMMILSLAYAPRMTWVFHRSASGPKTLSLPLLAVLLHMVVQSGFTAVVHIRRLVSQTGHRGWQRFAAAALCGVVPFLLPCLFADRTLFGMGLTEAGYRAFLGCYGLVFPAYIWICAPRGRAPSGISAAVFAAVVALAAPLFAVGFLGGRMGALVPALAIVLAGRVVADMAASSARARSTETTS